MFRKIGLFLVVLLMSAGVASASPSIGVVNCSDNEMVFLDQASGDVTVCAPAGFVPTGECFWDALNKNALWCYIAPEGGSQDEAEAWLVGDFANPEGIDVVMGE
ncbi:hypothetical protein ACFL08_05405 [Patescibacteria group bacterium]